MIVLYEEYSKKGIYDFSFQKIRVAKHFGKVLENAKYRILE
jgi:hypothetical protein